MWECNQQGERKPVPNFVHNIFVPNYAKVNNGELWVQFPKIMDAKQQELMDISRLFPEIDPLQFRSYLEDQQGNIWFATTFGLVVVELQKNNFKRLLYDENAPGGRGKACRGLLEKDGWLTVNTELNNQGRYLINPKTGITKRIPGLAGTGIGESSDGNIWTDVSREFEPYWYISLQKTTPTGSPIGPNFTKRKPNGFIWTILETSPDCVLLGHSNGVTRYNPLLNEAQAIDSKEFPEWKEAFVSWLGKDRASRIWACTDQGLYLLDPDGTPRLRYWSGGEKEYQLPYDNILHFYEDQAGIFWLGTAGGGLIRWDQNAPLSQRTTVIFRKNGLLNGVVYACYEDGYGHLWMPTDYGIVQFDKSTLQVRHTWLTTHGLTNNEFNRISHGKGADGALYFGGLNGVTAFHPDDFYQHNANEKACELALSNYSVLYQSREQLVNQTYELNQNRTITLTPDVRYVQLEFSLLDFIAPEKVTYTWKLEGISTDWEPLKEPELRFSNLPYGSYQLRIRAQASDGSWAKNELVFTTRVIPPFYRQWWFVVCAFGLMAVGVWAWASWRTRAHRAAQERLETEVARQTATIRHQAEELKKMDQAKSRFFANVSHELRTPLTLINGPLSALLKNGRLEGRELAHAITARQHSEQLMRLVNELLDLSKMESGKMVLQETSLSLQPFLNRVVSAFESHAERLEIQYLFDYQLPERLRVIVDENKLQKILNNLISNALKFTAPYQGNRVLITAEDNEGAIRIGVEDNGRGISPEDMPYIFDRFFQTKQQNAPSEGGFGIGLALCKEYIQVMKGRIWAESTLGKGSTFWIEFPKKEAIPTTEPTAESMGDVHYEPLPSKAPAVPHIASGERPSLLIVEDNDSLRDYLQSILEGQFQLLTARNGIEALNLINPSVQMVISDIMMPLMDGFQLLEHLKSADEWRHVPVIMLTARADIRDKLRALRIGVDDYLLKPFEEEELIARINNLLERQSARTAQPDNALPPELASASEGVISLTVSPQDAKWLESLEQLVSQSLDDSRLSADWLAHQLYTGRNAFFKKVKQLTGLTPNDYITVVRMTQARQLLETRQCSSVKEAAYSVGFKDVKYFSAQFQKHFGKIPSAYL